MTYDVGNTSPGLGQAQKWGMVKPVNGIPTAIQLLTNDKKPTQILSYSKRPHPTTKMNDNIKMDRTITGSMKWMLVDN